jgi:phosphoadenosine phosphosulfate reductase
MELKNLEEKITKSKQVIQEALNRFPNKIALAWTGGKDSTTILHLLHNLYDGKVPIPILNIDTSVKFKEIYEFRDRIAQEWNIDLIIERNDEALKSINIAENKEECCTKLKSEMIANAISKYKWEALITGMRWDEQPDRIAEAYFSPRQNPSHIRVHPILHFTELDIWQYIKQFQVPHCSLYLRGYRSLGCEPCTKLGIAGGAEREGRDQSKEEIMKRLRAMGYF